MELTLLYNAVTNGYIIAFISWDKLNILLSKLLSHNARTLVIKPSNFIKAK